MKLGVSLLYFSYEVRLFHLAVEIINFMLNV
jgi:hypothetical protein